VKGRKKSSSDAAPQGKNVKVVYYWGIDALAAICVGDLGDVIEVYDRILSHAQSPGVIAHGAQQKELTDFAEGRLRDLAVRDPWLYAHAIAFAEASHGELKASGPLRLRQYAEVSVTIDVEHAKELFPLIVKLIDHGVFVVTGATARTKHRHSASHLEFKLAYRKLLGLTNRIPLSMRDRFELTGPKLEQWLRAPTSQMLRSAKKTTIRRPAEEKEAENRSLEQGRSVLEKSRRASLNVLTPTLFDPIQTDSELSSLPQKRMPIPEVLYEVETLQNVDVSDAKLDWGRTWVVAAAGFEDRSVGTWSNLLRVGRPAGVVLLSYPDPKNINRDNQQKIVEMLDAAGVMHCSLDTDGVPHPNIARRVKSLAKGDIVVDTTSLTKPLIFMLVRDLLVEDNRVRVLHTCAEQYLPTSRQLKPVVELLDGKKYRAAFDLLDERVSGEKGPYVPTWVDKLYFDPSRPVFLAISISLKHGPISAILDQGPVENIAVLFPLHSGRTRASRSLIARHLAEYLAEVYRGEAIPVASLDYETAYRRFVTLHERYSLQSAMNFEIGLAGPKLHTVGAAMFAATATPAGVYYSRPDTFDKTAFTRGTAHTSFIELCRVERRDARV
jgi:hypothetical protein